jgi:DNA invertase Pin-like site-specific DNA recombinase
MSATQAVKVTVRPAAISRTHQNILNLHRKKRVAAYARVSTDMEEQLNSYEAQVDFYTGHIKANAEWDFVEVYTDEGISATSTKKRDGFNRMIQDALDGKIDLILTKSVSRFARNTVDSLTTVRQLKEKGVEVYFEKENIYTLDSKGELLITIMSSLAQEESRSISENVTWGQRKRMADGKVSLPYGQFLGYEKGEDGLPKIVESEAETVRLIYKMYLNGKTVTAITKHLTASGILTPSGKERWCVSTVLSILQNEKYKGDALLQKKFTVDFLTKVTKVNEGEVPQYYVENSHPAIIAPEVFDLVQEEIKRNRETGASRSGAHCFSGKVVCGECGGFYGSKVWQSTNKYRRTVWQCNNKYKKKGVVGCHTPHLNEDTLRWAFTEAWGRILTDKERYIEEYDEIIRALMDTASLDKEAARLQEECMVVYELIGRCVDENARTAQDQEEYAERYNGLLARYDAAKKQSEDIEEERQSRSVRKEKIIRFLADMKMQDGLLTEFDEELWCATVDTVTVHSEKDVAFTFRDGTEIHVDVRGK